MPSSPLVMGATTRRSLRFDATPDAAQSTLSAQLLIIPSTSASQAALLIPNCTARVALHNLPSTTMGGAPPSAQPSTSWISLPGRLLTSMLRSDDPPSTPDTPVQPPWAGQSPSSLDSRRTPPSSAKKALRTSGVQACVPVVLRHRDHVEELHEVVRFVCGCNTCTILYSMMAPRCSSSSTGAWPSAGRHPTASPSACTVRLVAHNATRSIHTTTETPPTGSGDFSLTKLARSFTRSGPEASGRSVNTAQHLVGWASYLLLPEVLGRELRCVVVLAWCVPPFIQW